MLANQAKYPIALDYFESARQPFENHGARPELDQLFDDQSLVFLELGRIEDARAAVDRSLKLGVQLGWARGKGRSQLILGMIAMRVGEFEEARNHIEEARENYAEVGDDVGLSAAFSLLGDVAARQREFDIAIRSYKEARRIQQGHGDLRGLGQTFRKLGALYYQRHEYQRAEETFEQAEEHLRRIRDPREHGTLALVQGTLSVAMGEHRTAVRYFERALGHFRTVGDSENLTETYKRLAASHQALEQYVEAMAAMREMGLEQAALWKSLLHSMRTEVSEASADRYLAGDYGDAVHAVFTVLERAFQERAPDAEGHSVSSRIRHWITADARGLSPFPDEDALRAFQNFCVGAFGVFRNAAVHEWRTFDGVDAFAGIAVAHVIASLIDAPGTERPLIATGSDDSDAS